MKSLKGIGSFVAVVSTGSFAAAARAQGVSAVAVSKNVATLERQLGIRLLQRTTRKMNVTVEGATFYQQCLGPLRELESAQSNVQRVGSEISGLLRVTSVSPIARTFIVPLLEPFHARYPKVQVELHLDDAVSDMVSKGYDVGIRVGALKDASVIARTIAPMSFVVCGSPGYLRRFGAPRLLGELEAHNCLRLRRVGSNDAMPWSLAGLDRSANQRLQGNFFANDFHALLDACARGLGLACLPLPLVMPLFRSGQLRPVLTEHIESRADVYLHYPSRRNLPARTRCFVEFVVNQLRDEHDLQTPHQQLIAPFVSA
jgi:DNA-binding transcriptional LysR family regulator